MRNVESFDFVIFGGGIFGLFAANLLGKKGLKVCLIELGDQVFSRASCINQARVHQGYHYPRSLSTAITSAKYFKTISKFGSYSSIAFGSSNTLTDVSPSIIKVKLVGTGPSSAIS